MRIEECETLLWTHQELESFEQALFPSRRFFAFVSLLLKLTLELRALRFLRFHFRLKSTLVTFQLIAESVKSVIDVTLVLVVVRNLYEKIDA